MKHDKPDNLDSDRLVSLITTDNKLTAFGDPSGHYGEVSSLRAGLGIDQEKLAHLNNFYEGYKAFHGNAYLLKQNSPNLFSYIHRDWPHGIPPIPKDSKNSAYATTAYDFIGGIYNAYLEGMNVNGDVETKLPNQADNNTSIPVIGSVAEYVFGDDLYGFVHLMFEKATIFSVVTIVALSLLVFKIIYDNVGSRW